MTYSRSFRGTFGTLILIAATAITTNTALLPTAAHADTSPLPTDAYGSTAMAQAMQTGQPVVEDSTTTESSQVTAEPNGQFQLTTSSGPVRAHTASGWQPIDTTLQTNSDGTFSPKVTVSPVTFSGGGSTLLVGIGTAQQGINTYWPTSLPTPTVSGNTATYANVRPNVNLVMSAQASGFSETLVVNTPAAAQDLVNNPVNLTAYGNGVTVTQQANGDITGTDATGKTVFGGGAPTAWDSSVLNGEPLVRPNAWQSANATERPLGLTARTVTGGQSLKISVPTTLLSSPTLQYPIYLDPEIGPSWKAWRTLETAGTSYNYGSAESSTQPMRVGYCNWTGCSPMGYNADSFFSFDTSAIVPKQTTAHIFSAEVQALQAYNAASYDTPVNLVRGTAIVGTSTTYPGPVGATLQQVSKNYGYNGGAGGFLDFNNSNVTSYLQDSANSNWATTTFGLTTPDTSNANYWKKFGTGAKDEVLTIYYDFPPSGPSNLSFNGNYVDCRTATPAQPLYITSATPTVSAKATSQDGMKIGMYFEVQQPSGTLVTQTPTPTTATGASGSQIPWRVPVSLTDGTYKVNARAQDLNTTGTGEYSPWGAYANFTVHATPPSAAPTVSSFSYPQNYWGVAQSDATGKFTFKEDPSIDSASIAGFSFSVDTAGAEQTPSGCAPYGTAYDNIYKTGIVPADTTGTGIWQPQGALQPGYHVLYVKAFDNAHLLSAETNYPFYVAPTYPNTTSTSGNLIEAEGSGISAVTSPAGQTGGYYTATSSSDSAGADTELVTNAAGSFTFALNPITSAPSTSYDALGVQLLTGPHNATVSFQVDGTDVTDPSGNLITADTCGAPGSMFVQLGGQTLDGSKPHSIKVIMISTDGTCQNPGNVYSGNYGPQQTALNFNDNGYTVGVDYFMLAPIRDLTYNNFASAANNTGITWDTKGGAFFEPTTASGPPDQSLSWNALGTAGINQNSIFKYMANTSNEVDFPIGGSSSLGDNVVAAGQTIYLTDSTHPLQAPAGASSTSPGYLDLLVASTCGQVPASHSKALSIAYITSTGDVVRAGTDNLVPWVPNWLDSSGPDSAPIGAGGKAIQLDHYDDATGTPVQQNGANQPAFLYVWKVRLQSDLAGKAIRYVVLPNLGTDFTNTCDATGNALHVLSITDSPN